MLMSLAAMTVEPAQTIADVRVVVESAPPADFVKPDVVPDKIVIVVRGLMDAVASSFP